PCRMHPHGERPVAPLECPPEADRQVEIAEPCAQRRVVQMEPRAAAHPDAAQRPPCQVSDGDAALAGREATQAEGHARLVMTVVGVTVPPCLYRIRARQAE